MKTFDRDEVLAFLAEIDEMLAEPAAMEIIGGAAALLAYGAHSATKDIDSLANIDERIQHSCVRGHSTLSCTQQRQSGNHGGISRVGRSAGRPMQ